MAVVRSHLTGSRTPVPERTHVMTRHNNSAAAGHSNAARHDGHAAHHSAVRRGRPRSDAAEAAILAAAIEVLAERGFSDTSVDQIAARAHAGKDTIYRRWPHKSDLVRAALDHLEDIKVEVPDSGSLSVDLGGYLTGIARLLEDPRFGDIVLSLVGESRHDPLFAGWIDRFWSERRDVIESIIARAVQRGEATPEQAALAPELLLGPLCYSWLVRGGSSEEPYIRSLIARVLGVGDRARSVADVSE